jgi:hypothetical protein
MDLVEECLSDGCSRIPAARRSFSDCIDPKTDLNLTGGKKPGG